MTTGEACNCGANYKQGLHYLQVFHARQVVQKAPKPKQSFLCAKIHLLMIMVTYGWSFQPLSPHIARKTNVSLVSRSTWFPWVANRTRWTLCQNITRSPYTIYIV